MQCKGNAFMENAKGQKGEPPKNKDETPVQEREELTVLWPARMIFRSQGYQVIDCSLTFNDCEGKSGKSS